MAQLAFLIATTATYLPVSVSVKLGEAIDRLLKIKPNDPQNTDQIRQLVSSQYLIPGSTDRNIYPVPTPDTGPVFRKGYMKEPTHDSECLCLILGYRCTMLGTVSVKRGRRKQEMRTDSLEVSASGAGG